MSPSKSQQDPILALARQRVAKILKQIHGEAPASVEPPYALSPRLVHSVRVCTKQLRALLPLYRPVLSKSRIRTVDQAVKALAKAYAGQRDAQVQYETLCWMVEQYQQTQPCDLQPLVAYFAARIGAEAAPAAAMDPVAGLDTILVMWQRELAPKQVPDFACGVDFTYRRGRKLAYEAEASDDDEVYHECRKWAKYYLYQLQMLQGDPRPKDKALIKQLKVLGQRLGEFHDRCVLEAALNGLLAREKGSEPLEQAALLMLSWLVEQKRVDKLACQRGFEGVFARPHSPAKLAS